VWKTDANFFRPLSRLIDNCVRFLHRHSYDQRKKKKEKFIITDGSGIIISYLCGTDARQLIDGYYFIIDPYYLKKKKKKKENNKMMLLVKILDGNGKEYQAARRRGWY
jgi:hypothetical protein